MRLVSNYTLFPVLHRYLWGHWDRVLIVAKLHLNIAVALEVTRLEHDLWRSCKPILLSWKLGAKHLHTRRLDQLLSFRTVAVSSVLNMGHSKFVRALPWAISAQDRDHRPKLLLAILTLEKSESIFYWLQEFSLLISIKHLAALWSCHLCLDILTHYLMNVGNDVCFINL